MNKRRECAERFRERYSQRTMEASIIAAEFEIRGVTFSARKAQKQP